MTTPQPVLALTGIHKSFPGVKALTDVSLRLYPGEVHALMGQNGAGKSTLIKVLTGLYTPEAGRITLDGETIAPRRTEEAQALGIQTVYQEVNLCTNLSVAENICAGRFPRKWGRIDWQAVNAEAKRVLAQMDLDIDVTAPLSRYSLSVQQMVAIARALRVQAKVLILDEPTSSLDDAAVQRLFTVLKRLRSQGLAILFVTHFLDQTYALADRITVMRNGETEGEYLASDLSRLALVNKMVGAPPDQQPTRLDSRAPKTGAPVLKAQGLSRRGALHPLDLELRRGEVLGLAGLLGSGRTEAARLLFGADTADAGHVETGEHSGRWHSPRQAIAAGIAFCSEDRKHEGAILDLSVRDNILLALQARAGLRLVMNHEQQQALADDYIQRLGIKTPNADTPIGQLSGGNQQKALMARWLATDPAVLILDEPTRGIDVRAKEDLMDAVRALAHREDGQGMSILFISSELPEVLHCSDRVLVLRDRRAAGEYRRGELDERSVLEVIAAEPAATEAA
ncbi:MULTISPECIES: sugar ABC transporter ATP-binding protein [unclassified Roseateles]|uniref:sugar ABC transporter ATP-binding protein n=1 Tax=unclassified Roseateles TaxID=2626991 RepID=UPI0006F323A7|nr:MULTISPECIES: sugar ABC transporter ATP-binding protein [unclassified Roseateles]KQW45331.1 sugar ABC transporter ATP-binding protein [Pelomonas sp. Root405]KRA72175.1 sugar ABC transporter ATP-binding protein [Pelomonas sp. Root662]